MQSPGVCAVIETNVAAIAKGMTAGEKFCTLSFDGMALKAALRYDTIRDRIVGFEDCGAYAGGRTAEVANEFIAVWLKGACSKWKQPIGHYLVRNSLGGSRLPQMISESLAAATRMGLNVCAVVCDQEASQWKCLKSLGACSDNSTITVNLTDGTKATVPVFVDVPHCIKNMRNALQKYWIEFADGDKRLTARWADIVCVAEIELQKPDQLRLVPKLQECHVALTVGKKMSVRLAAQVLSRTMAHAMAVYMEYGILSSSTAQGTARFCERVNELFDLTNNATNFHSISADNLEVKAQEISDWITWLETLKFLTHDGKVFNGIKFHQGWAFSLRSLQTVSRELISSGVCDTVCARNFTQDHVENGFSCMRRRGGFNDCPEYREATAAFRSLAINQLLGCPSEAKNCEHDNGILLTVEMTHKASHPAAHLTVVPSRPDDAEASRHDVASLTHSRLHTSGVEDNGYLCMTELAGEGCDVSHEKCAYVGGWLLFKLFRTQDHCQDCLEDLTDRHDQGVCNGMQFLRMKNYTREGQHAGSGLTVPSRQVVRAVMKMELAFNSQITVQDCYSKLKDEGVSVRLRPALTSAASAEFQLHSKPHTDSWLAIMCDLFLRMRLHHWCKTQHETLRSGKRNHSYGLRVSSDQKKVRKLNPNC